MGPTVAGPSAGTAAVGNGRSLGPLAGGAAIGTGGSGAGAAATGSALPSSGMPSSGILAPGVGKAGTIPPLDEPRAGYIRRLSHTEYDNTVEGLLRFDAQPSSGFAPEVALQAFTNNAAGQNVTPTLAEQYVEAAEALSKEATKDLTGLLACDLAVLGEAACVERFIVSFGQRAWRRPLRTEERARMSGLFTTARAENELDISVQMLVQAFLLSPQFLYLVEPLPQAAPPGSIVPLDSWKVASRLSYFLTGTLPDEALFAAAEAGSLETAAAVATQARRLLESPGARARIGQFFTEWLRLRHLDKLQKDPTLFPDYDLTWGPLLREQVELFAQAVILDEGGTAKDLLTAPFTFVNEQLAPLYGVSAPAGNKLSRVELDPTQRAGLLTHAALLATLAHQNQTDPVVRGKFIRESVLCGSVPPVPAGLVVTAPVVTPGSSTRERFRQHQEEPTCAACHALMDPIGLGFEHYDPLGQWRSTDNGQEVDATGEIVGTDVAGTFDGAIELSQKLAESEQVMNCFARTWLRFALGRSEQAGDDGALAVAGDKFRASGFKMSELLISLTQTRAFRYQQVLDPNTSALKETQ